MAAKGLNRKVKCLWRVVKIAEYEPMAAEAVQEQIHEGFEWDIDKFMKGGQDSGIGAHDC